MANMQKESAYWKIMRYQNTLKMISFDILAKSVDHHIDGSSWVHQDLEQEYIKIHLVLQHGTHLFPVSASGTNFERLRIII